MADPTRDPDTTDVLALQALLYAGDALAQDEARRFEQRLAQDQAAREALSRAVQVLHGEPLRPDPAYRRRVRGRAGRSGLLSWLLRPRPYRGHPAAWGLLGAAAAVLVLVGLGWVNPFAARAGAGHPGAAAVLDLDGALSPQDEAVRTAEQAAIWAELPSGEHLLKVSHEEARRRARADTLSRLVKTEQGRSRLLATPSSKH
jgi:hypothetical protein